MSLENGSRLGPYEIVAPLGAGGMGEVYRARDPRLGRDVAIKLLPDEFAEDPERLARFEREARLLASLQHANIAVLHGLEEANGRRFLVMQCVEGESLAQRLKRGPLSLADTLETAVAIAAALEAAHEGGIVHRDLKPGNVMVTPSGDVKVLDFGLAKGGAGTTTPDSNLSASPTHTYAATSAGMILGTAAYMSPEQARGKAVDRRTDIWSFGCVLYECLSGRQVFPGDTVSDIVARILQTEPDWEALPKSTPGRLRDLIARCLQKDAKRRLRDIGDARIELEDLLAGRVSASGAHSAPASTITPRRPWVVPAVVALVALAAAAAWFGGRALAPRSSGGPTRFSVSAPRDQILPGDAMAVQISPDGRALALIAADSAGTPRLWLRSMDSLEPRLVPGSENVTLSFWSPDSRWVAFCSGDRQLFKVALAGGGPEPICDVKTARGGSWSRDGVILIAPYASGGLYRVPPAGGEPALVMRPDSAHGETGMRFPCFLPDGKHFLYSSLPADSTGKGRICLGSLDGGPSRVVMHAESGVVYVEPGWLLCTRRGTLVAQRFDPRTVKLVGEPVPLGDAPQISNFGGAPLVSVSSTGVVAYMSSDRAPVRLVWLDLQGKLLNVPAVAPGNYQAQQLSPDEHQVLLIGAAKSGQDAYVATADLDRGILTRLTQQTEFAAYPNWGPDGRHFAYMEQTGRQRFIVRSLVDESRREFLGDDPSFKQLYAWSKDGRYLVYGRLDAATKWDVWRLTLDGSEPPMPLVHSAGNEINAGLSADGRWLSYSSDESGQYEIYVAPFGGAGPRYQVTNGGGLYSGWAKDASRLLYVTMRQPDVVMQAEVLPGPTFRLGASRPFGRVPTDAVSIDIDHASRRLMVLEPAEQPRPQTVTILQGWPAALAKR